MKVTEEIYVKYVNVNSYAFSKGLLSNNTYRVSEIMMGQSSTSVKLVKHDGVFNSIRFEFYDYDGGELNIFATKYNPYISKKSQIEIPRKEEKNKYFRTDLGRILQINNLPKHYYFSDEEGYEKGLFYKPKSIRYEVRIKSQGDNLIDVLEDKDAVILCGDIIQYSEAKKMLKNVHIYITSVITHEQYLPLAQEVK